MKQDRFLLGILIGIALLVLSALIVFFVRQDSLVYGPEDSPEGVVRNYLVAVYKRDYPQAYTYLADLPHKPDYDTFRQSFLTNMVAPDSAGADVGDSSETGKDEAIVSVSVIYSPGDPFSSGSRNTESAFLVRQDGKWKLRQMPYTFWGYDWYQEPFKP